MLTIKIYPNLDYLQTFLEKRGVKIADSHPNILHYTGDNLKELRKCLKIFEPDLLIFHKEIPFGKLPKGLFWIYHPFNNQKELYQTKKLYTNTHRLCQIYYQRLGFQAEIRVIQQKLPVKKHEVNFTQCLGKIKEKCGKISEMMFWK